MAKALLYFVNRSEIRQQSKDKTTRNGQGSVLRETKVVCNSGPSRARSLDGGDEELLVPIASMKAMAVRKEMNFAMMRNVATLGGTHGE